jgi:uncharacterized cupin superfamily protein
VREAVNLYDVEVKRDDGDPPGYETPYARVGPLIGASALGLSVYDLTTGQSVCPYHYEYGNEEWLVVLTGTPTLRDPDGERELEPGDVVLFPDGPDGAHKLTNRGDGVVRIAILSTKHDPSIAVYPDSNKVGIWPPGKLFRLADAVDYYTDEP